MMRVKPSRAITLRVCTVLGDERQAFMLSLEPGPYGWGELNQRLLGVRQEVRQLVSQSVSLNLSSCYTSLNYSLPPCISAMEQSPKYLSTNQSIYTLLVEVSELGIVITFQHRIASVDDDTPSCISCSLQCFQSLRLWKLLIHGFELCRRVLS